jgi:hypothetical protein
MTIIRIVQQDTVVHVVQPDNEQTVVKISGVGVQGAAGPRLVEVVHTISGLVPASREVLGYLASSGIEFLPDDAVAVAGTANPSDFTITISTLADVVVGTVAFLSGETVGTVTLDPLTLAQGEGLKFYYGATATAIADVVVTLPANRN